MIENIILGMCLPFSNQSCSNSSDIFAITWVATLEADYHMTKLILFVRNGVGEGEKGLNLKAPIMTAADDKFCIIFPNFRKKIRYDIT